MPTYEALERLGVGYGSPSGLIGLVCFVFANTRRERRDCILASEPAQSTEAAIPDAKAL